MNCVTSGIVDPPDICSHKFIEASLNYNMIPTNGLLLAAKEAFGDDFAPEYEEMTGRGWLLGYLANTYIGNIISSTKGKWKAVINDSIEAYGMADIKPNARFVVKFSRQGLIAQILLQSWTRKRSIWSSFTVVDFDFEAIKSWKRYTSITPLLARSTAWHQPASIMVHLFLFTEKPPDLFLLCLR